MDQLLKPTTAESKPTLFFLKNKEDKEAFENLFKKDCIKHINDDYKEQLSELFAIENPKLVFSPDFENKLEEYLAKVQKKSPLSEQGTWVYYPWLSRVVHVLPDKEFQKVRTARNKLLITDKEQQAFYNQVIGVAGLSVGNSVALTTILQGGSKHIKIADHDILELSNLNRIRVGVDSLAVPKVEATAREIYLINPYAIVEVFPNGITEENIKDFFKGLDVVVDEIDELSKKHLLRQYAQKNRIPLVSGADNADQAVVDIERYDLDKNTKFFHGKITASYEDLQDMDKFETGKNIAQLIGLENHEERMLESLQAMGKKIASWPQLGGTAMLNGAAVAYCLRRIANKQSVIGKRTVFALDKAFDPEFMSQKSKKRRKGAIEAFKKIFKK
tara:strand:- start:160736 stop:161899 length:1164 start_codon:yes stop_codon:yes gene_type:complete